MAHRFKHASNLAVSAFGNRHLVPAVGAFTTARFEGAELGHSVVKLHAIEQALFLLVVQCAQNAHRILTLQPKTRMHQPVGELARAGQQQQAFGIEVQTADRLPLALKQFGQAPKHRRAILRVVM